MIRNSFTCATELLTDKRLIYSIFRKFNKTLLASVKPSSIIKKSQITLPFTLLKAGNCYEFGSLFRRKFLFQEPLRNIFKNKDLHSSRRFSTGYGWPRLTKICSIFLIEQLLPEPCVRSVVVSLLYLHRYCTKAINNDPTLPNKTNKKYQIIYRQCELGWIGLFLYIEKGFRESSLGVIFLTVAVRCWASYRRTLFLGSQF